MSYFRVCPLCGAALDPVEQCEDCKNEQRENKEKAAQGVSSTQGGGVETGLTAHISASSLSNNVEENQVWILKS